MRRIVSLAAVSLLLTVTACGGTGAKGAGSDGGVGSDGGSGGSNGLTVKITHPQDRSIFPSGTRISFVCAVSKGGTAVPAARIRWTSDGTQISIGAQVQTVVKDGTHHIACLASDPAGDTGRDTITITVGDPAIRIDHPADGATLPDTQQVQFTAQVLSLDSGTWQNQHVVWKSDGNQIGTGLSIVSNPGSDGTHHITATYTNSKGTSVTDGITIKYMKPTQPPVVTITKPASDGSSYAAGTTVPLAGTAIDPQDGNITAKAKWFSAVLGSLGTGGSAVVPSAQAGKYAVTLSATDSAGATSTATRVFYVMPPGGGPLHSTQLPGQNVTGVSGGGGNGVWVAAGNNFVRTGTPQVTKTPNQVNINNGNPTSAAQGQSANGPVAFGTDGGLSVCTIPVSPATCTSYTDQLKTALDTRHVNKVAVLPDGTVVVATGSGLFVISPGGSTHGYNGNNWQGSDRVNDLAVGSNGLVYLATDSGLVAYDPVSHTFTRYPRDGLPTHTLTAVAARNGAVWVGSSQGISHLIGQAGSWSWNNYGQQQGLNPTGVTCLALDSNGVVWGGTGGGAFRFDEAVGRFLMITRADGLPSNNVTSIYIDLQDVKYFGTTNGLGIWYGK